MVRRLWVANLLNASKYAQASKISIEFNVFKIPSASTLKAWAGCMSNTPGLHGVYLNWRRLDGLRFEFSEPPRS